MSMSATVTHAPNRYHLVQMNTASLNYAPTKGYAYSSLKGVPLHCIVFKTATDPCCGFRVIIMTQANSQVNIRALELLSKFRIKKMNRWCTV